MDSEKIIDILNYYPSTELLKRKNRNFIIRFLNDTFQETRNPLSDNIVIDKLIDYLERYQTEADDDEKKETDLMFETLDVKAKNFLRQWTDRGYLTYFTDPENGQTLYELSFDTIKVIDWLVSLQKTEYVGTESKFDNIRTSLKDLVENSNEDKETRLSILQERKNEIEKQITAINNGEDIKVYEDYQIVERFDNLSKQSRELLSDFKQVDDNFAEITKKLYAQYSSKGQVLGDFFEAFYDLKNTTQGKSFYAFWDFMRSSDLQEEMEELVAKLYSIMEERKIKQEDMFLRNMIDYLYASGQKVSGTNDKMAQKLSRILSERENRNAIKELLSEIKNSLIKISTLRKLPDISLEIETEIAINIPFERKLTLTPKEDNTYNTNFSNYQTDIQDFDSLHSIYKNFIDSGKIKERINQVLLEKKHATISQIINYYGGTTQGLGEVFAYLGLAKDFRHVVNDSNKESIIFDHTNNKIIEIPEIIFTK